MDSYKQLSKDELLAMKTELEASYNEKKALNLKLDMSRGKPSTKQLNVSMGIMDTLSS